MIKSTKSIKFLGHLFVRPEINQIKSFESEGKFYIEVILNEDGKEGNHSRTLDYDLTIEPTEEEMKSLLKNDINFKGFDLWDM